MVGIPTNNYLKEIPEQKRVGFSKFLFGNICGDLSNATNIADELSLPGWEMCAKNKMRRPHLLRAAQVLTKLHGLCFESGMILLYRENREWKKREIRQR